jgi:hypothetical protein
VRLIVPWRGRSFVRCDDCTAYAGRQAHNRRDRRRSERATELQAPAKHGSHQERGGGCEGERAPLVGASCGLVLPLAVCAACGGLQVTIVNGALASGHGSGVHVITRNGAV